MSLLANLHLGGAGSKTSFAPTDFLRWPELQSIEQELIELDNAEQQSDYIKAAIFGKLKDTKDE